MAQTIKSVKQKLTNGTYSSPIPFGADGINIDLANGHDLEATLGTVDVVNKGTVQAQLDKHTTDVAANKLNIESNDVDIATLQSRTTVNETNISTHTTQIADRYTKAEVDTLLAEKSEFVEVETW